jgi:two-component system, chemotaxis family, response regulator PixG
MTSASTETVYPLNPGTNPLQLMGIAQQVIQSEINGRLSLMTQAGQRWDLYFQLGRIVWASGGEHRFRRWHRVLRQLGISPASIQMREQILPDQWEHLVLSVLLKRNRLKREDVIRAIETNITEVLFDLLQASAYISQMVCNVVQKNIDDSPVTILGTPDDFINQARQQLKAWQLGGLGDYSPNFAPVITSHEALKKHASPQMYVTLVSALTGKSALRDIAQIKRQSLTDLAIFLRPYVEKNLLAFQPIADFPPPMPKSMGGDRRGNPERRDGESDRRDGTGESSFSNSGLDGNSVDYPATAVTSASAAQGPLIVCIDDSPQVGYILEQVLVPLGYQVLSIQDPIQALSTLMRRKPDFIFLDLIMPVINGYELCGQIRRISSLKETPVAILTGNDGVVDRVRAKMVGANDFLAKPVVPEKVMAVLQKHVQYQPAPMAASAVA